MSPRETPPRVTPMMGALDGNPMSRVTLLMALARSLTGACLGVITELPSAIPTGSSPAPSLPFPYVSEPLDVQLLKRTEPGSAPR